MDNFTQIKIRKTTKKHFDELQKDLSSIMNLGPLSQSVTMVWLIDLGKREIANLKANLEVKPE